MPVDYPSRIDIVPWAAWAASAVGTPTRTNASNYLDLGVLEPNVGTINNMIAWDVLLKAGTWTLTVVHRQNNNRGIYSTKLDTTVIGSFDGYAASATANVASTIAGVVVGTAGKRRLSFLMDTKNGASSNYFYGLHHITLQRTGA